MVDLKKAKAKVTNTNIKGIRVEVVDEYKYLGGYLDPELDWC